MRELLQGMTFMQTAMALFIAELLLLVSALAWAVATAGNAGWPVSLMGILVFLFGCFGVAVTLYGHYTVEAESRINWKIGLYTNGACAAAVLILTMIGLFV